VKIAVVIPALDEAHDIGSAVLSARAGEAEIVVVDGGSSDDTRSLARAAGARVIESPPGRARQLQAGVAATEESGTEAVLFLHADTRLSPGWERAVARALSDRRVAGGAFRLHFDGDSTGLRLLEWGVRLRVAVFRLPYGDQAIFARRTVLQEIGGVPMAGFMEDLDLVQALKQRGRLVCLSDAVTTSPRRYQNDGVIRTTARHLLAATAWSLGIDRDRIERWVRG
jgi:rSAM/selenodomain-associated transferase 2